MSNHSRPILSIPRTMSEKIMNTLSVFFLVGIYVYLIVLWGDIPGRVPAHFNALGEPDRWGGKVNLLILPIVGTFIYGLTSIISRFPHAFNYPVEITQENAERLYIAGRKMMTTLNFWMTFFFALGAWETVQVALGKGGLGVWFLPGLLLSTFGTIGYYIYRIIVLRKPKSERRK